jgi:glycosyltransferase involved in cell wall biosynthesis
LHPTSTMPKTKLTGLLHTSNDALHLERALDSLRACDEVIVVDHGSSDDTVNVARQHGAKVLQAVNGVDRGAYVQDASNDWILCLRPTESLAEELEASLFEWRENEHADNALGFNIAIREQKGQGWEFLPPEMRLANRKQINWTGDLPPQYPNAPSLRGHILRIPAQE